MRQANIAFKSWDLNERIHITVKSPVAELSHKDEAMQVEVLWDLGVNED